MASKKKDTSELEQFTLKGERRNRQLLEYVAILQQQIEKGATEEVGELRAALGVAKERLVEQNSLLKQLTSEPLVNATVLRVNLMVENMKPFLKGSRAKALPGARSHVGQIGIVENEPDGDGEVILLFPDG